MVSSPPVEGAWSPVPIVVYADFLLFDDAQSVGRYGFDVDGAATELSAYASSSETFSGASCSANVCGRAVVSDAHLGHGHLTLSSTSIPPGASLVEVTRR